ncbi:PPE domain-containing protein [Mycobacterium sp. SMC-17]|uniref:PPE domain-containing protein n=1 Tax=Mycobacterium sp. SMC-17 TaxID=3381628 RepID=UPI003875E753
MKIDAPGLVMAAQRLMTAVQAVQGAGVPHPPLAADSASVGAAERLTTTAGELTTSMAGHISGLVTSLEVLTGLALGFTVTDETSAEGLATLKPTGNASAPTGFAPPAPPVPPDFRPPLPPPAAPMPEALSASVHAGDPSAGEPFIAAWNSVGTTAKDTADAVRFAVASLPETLDAPMSTPAITAHLNKYADGLQTYGERATGLAQQASAHADNYMQARENIPSPQVFTQAKTNIANLQRANAASGGKYAGPLMQALADKGKLDQNAVTGYGTYHAATETDTAGEPADGTDPGAVGGDPSLAGLGPDGLPTDPTTAAASPEDAGQMASMLPQMIPTVLGAVGGLAGGLLGGLTKVPETLMQAGTQAASAAAQGLGQLGQKMDPPTDSPNTSDPGLGAGDPSADLGGGGGDPSTSPAGGEGTPDLRVAPSTGAPPTPAYTPAGAADVPTAAGPGGGGMSGMPMGGMPMGGMGGAGDKGKDGEAGRRQRLVTRDIPNTEDVTGRTQTNRLVAASTSNNVGPEPDPPDEPPTTTPRGTVIRRIKTRPPKDPE